MHRRPRYSPPSTVVTVLFSLFRWSDHLRPCPSCLQYPPDWTSCSRGHPAPTVHLVREPQPRWCVQKGVAFIRNIIRSSFLWTARCSVGWRTRLDADLRARSRCFYLVLIPLSTLSGLSQSQRQASSSSSIPERPASSSASRAPPSGEPGLQTPEATAALHPGPAFLDLQLHGPSAGHQSRPSPSRPVLACTGQRQRCRGN